MTALPDAAETLLLRAALGDGAAALAAWESWRARVDLEHVVGDSVGLVPLLYRNLRRLGVDAATTARYASVYRHSWAQNRLAFRATAEVLAALRAAGVDTLVLKGAALALGFYRDVGARPMNDVDVMVPAARRPDAVRVLRAAGYTTTASPRDLALGYSAPFVDPRGRNIDLHWHLSWAASHAGADEPFWSASRHLVVEGEPTRALAPTDMLYHVVEHAQASNDAHLRWAADAMVVLQGGDIDWARLADLARARRTVLPLRAGLDFLRRALDAPIPDAALAAAPVALLDRLEHRRRASARPYTVANVLLGLWCGHRRSTTATGTASALEFPAYLARYYGVVSPWQLPAIGVKRGLRRLQTHGLL